MEKIYTKNAPEPVGPYSQGVLADGKILFISSQLPINVETNEMEEDIEKATIAVLNNIKSIIEEAGGSKENITKVTIMMKDIGEFPLVNEIYGNFFGSHKPARACYQAAALPRSAVIMMEAYGVI